MAEKGKRGLDVSASGDPAAPGVDKRDDKEVPASGDSAAPAVDDKVAKVLADFDDLRQTLIRRQADFENYRKRVERERSEDSRRAMARVIQGLIPVLDGFEHALAAHKEEAYAEYRRGFELIYKQLLEGLAKLGLQRHDPIGKKFDPHLHEAMDRAETDEQPEGTILEVYQPGYVFHGHVLRPAMVRVAAPPAVGAAPSATKLAN